MGLLDIAHLNRSMKKLVVKKKGCPRVQKLEVFFCYWAARTTVESLRTAVQGHRTDAQDSELPSEDSELVSSVSELLSKGSKMPCHFYVGVA